MDKKKWAAALIIPAVLFSGWTMAYQNGTKQTGSDISAAPPQASNVVYGSENIPGGSEDPVVTKSYVDKQLESAKSELQTGIDNLKNSVNINFEEVRSDISKISGGEQTVPSEGSGNGNPSDGSAAVFTVVEVPAGKNLIGGEGCQLILRSGTASAVDNGEDGISDLTSGTDLKGGAAVAKNHLIIVPRADGRGISCQTKCYVMVLGEYTLK